jgi:hypothetical protein
MNRFKQLIVQNVRRYGWRDAVYLLAMRVMKPVADVTILRGVYVEQPAAAFLTCPGQLAGGFLQEKRLREFGEDAETDLSDKFLDQALARGDECYALCDGAALAAYGWYSRRPTPIGLSNLELQFIPAYVYMYKGYTCTRYRGQRLHAIGMTLALQHYVANGFRGLVSYVEATNFDSLKSCFRMGYQVFGSVYAIRMFGCYFTFASPGCRRFGFRLHRMPAPSAARFSFGS